jgi:hypothetical protein
MARAWDSGQKPYRDIVAYNFPGQVYLFWLLGKAFGWGRTVPFYAVDALMVVAIGFHMLVWSRRLFQSVIPGLAGYFSFLVYYSNLGYDLVAQRDWHSAFFAVSGLMVLQMWPRRCGRVASALAYAIAFAFRPYAILFLPAFILELARVPDDSRRTRLGIAFQVLEWLAWLATFTVLMFAPLLLQGLLDDLFRGLTLLRHGGPYSNRSIRNRIWAIAKILMDIKILAVILGIVSLLFRARSEKIVTGRTWLVALVAMLLYAPLSPLQHGYLYHPLWLVLSVNVAVLTDLVVTQRDTLPEARLTLIALMMGMFVAGPPASCDLRWGLKMTRSFAHGEWPKEIPPGLTFPYAWTDYQDMLEYLRHETARDTRVANLLSRTVCAVCGEAGRLSPFPVEAPSLVWLVMTRIHSEADFASLLERTPDSVVVWAPSENGELLKRSGYAGGGTIDLKELTGIVRRLYEPEARFGKIEVWRRKPELASHEGQDRL